MKAFQKLNLFCFRKNRVNVQISVWFSTMILNDHHEDNLNALRMSIPKMFFVYLPVVLLVWRPLSLTSSVVSIYHQLILAIGALSQFTTVPALLFCSIWLLLLFVVFLNLSSFSVVKCIDDCILYYYTSMTRRVHLPKSRAPLQFKPSISFMGGKLT